MMTTYTEEDLHIDVFADKLRTRIATKRLYRPKPTLGDYVRMLAPLGREFALPLIGLAIVGFAVGFGL